MSRITSSFRVYKRPDTRKYFISIYPPSGLSGEICQKWQRRSFSNFPLELSHLRAPNSDAQALNAATMLIEYLKGPKNTNKTITAGKKLIPWLLDFWQSESPYMRHKALVEKSPLSAGYIKTSRENIERHVATYHEFTDITVGTLTKKLVKDWMLYLAEKGLSGRMINIVKQAVRVPINEAYKNEEISYYPFLNINDAYHEPKEKGILTEKGKSTKNNINRYRCRGIRNGKKKGEIL